MIKRTINMDDDGTIINSNDKYLSIFNNDGYLLKNRRLLYSCFRKDFIITNKLNDPADIGRLHILALHMYKDTNLIVYEKSRKVFPADIKFISEVIQLCERNTKTYINKMIKLGLIAKQKNKIDNKMITKYYLSPLYFFSGKRLSLELYNIFKRQLNQVLSYWVIQKYEELNNNNDK